MSDQYTPTTEQVRFAYIDRRDFDSQVGLSEWPGDEGVGREFDGWLASVKAEAWREGYGVGFENGLDLESHNARGIGPF